MSAHFFLPVPATCPANLNTQMKPSQDYIPAISAPNFRRDKYLSHQVSGIVTSIVPQMGSQYLGATRPR
jgi:hypothetical protein